MFETVDSALISSHPNLQINGRKTWQYVFRVVHIPWIHCVIAYNEGGLAAADIYFINDIYCLEDLFAFENVAIKELSIVTPKCTNDKWCMKDVSCLWKVHETNQVWYAFQLKDGGVFSSDEWCIIENKTISDFVNKEIVWANHI